jgi:hypothetical protein
MKFEHGDNTDNALVQTLVHEMMLCNDAFKEFVRHTEVKSLNPHKKEPKIKTYNAYSTFLHHLYEFYVGCFKRDKKNTEDIRWNELDSLFDLEGQKQLRNRRVLVENGIIEDKANLHIYQKPLPSGFGSNFRYIRNHTAHASIKRIVPSPGSDLNSFFKDYHFVIILMFFGAQYSWNLRDPEQHNWGPLEEFDFGNGA